MSVDESRQPLAAALYLVATPIGNLDDVTLRALKLLGDVDLILAEDTRRTRKLLSHFDIHTPLKSLHEHNEMAHAARLAKRLAGGENMALVSDAGTPLVSDPGYPLVRAALDAGVRVVPVPGASAPLAALTGSGLPTDRFLFVGYLPRKKTARLLLLGELAAEPGTLVFLESPRRLAAALADAAAVFGDRSVAVARELTKVHEEFIRGNLPEVAARFTDAEVRGEVTVCVAGCGDQAGGFEPGPEAEALRVSGLDKTELSREFDELTAGGTARNDALKTLAASHGVPRREVYRVLMVDRVADDGGLAEEE